MFEKRLVLVIATFPEVFVSTLSTGEISRLILLVERLLTILLFSYVGSLRVRPDAVISSAIWPAAAAVEVKFLKCIYRLHNLHALLLLAHATTCPPTCSPPHVPTTPTSTSFPTDPRVGFLSPSTDTCGPYIYSSGRDDSGHPTRGCIPRRTPPPPPRMWGCVR